MDELLSRLLADGRLSHMEKLVFLLLLVVGGREGHVQHKTLKEIGEYANPRVGAATLSDAIGPLMRAGWITGEKSGEKEPWDIRINMPSRPPGNVKTFEHRIGRTKVIVTIETEED